MNLNQVTLPVINMQDAVSFYQTLGFRLIVDTPHYARFSCPMGESTFSLSLESESGMKGVVIYFEHPQLDTWVDELVVKGIVFAQMPTDERYLWREAIVFDPSGNKIKLYWAGDSRLNPPWKVSD
ncbi:VOC family protein [Shewanella sp. OMA3-2]|uniref:VOC family protein n=1 Tax=Shewanella sp. OMA3-2 TaxID=2908650 RepID=UPI001F2EAAB9|nr:VOC family protein [Shewanella sp. OMA3-2]UJF20386.1 VOC family protein [Shewanella sp. OMA3-2]